MYLEYRDTRYSFITNMCIKWIENENIEFHKLKLKNLLASLADSHRALRAQLASLARMSAPGARDLMVVALRAPTYMNFALRAQCCVLHSA